MADPVPNDRDLHQLHDRYLLDVVEALSLCPFARGARESGEVTRVLVRLDGSPPTEPKTSTEIWHGPTIYGPTDRAMTHVDVAQILADTALADPRVVVVLLTFILPPEHPWRDRFAFDQMMQRTSAYHRDTVGAASGSSLGAASSACVGGHTRVEEDPDVHTSAGAGAGAAAQAGTPRFYMACFHPDPPQITLPHPMTAARLVHTIRRSPDPVIQAIRADVMDALRAQHRKRSHARVMRELEHLPKDIVNMIAHSSHATESLSDTIDRSNFKRVGPDSEDHGVFHTQIQEIHAARRLMGGGYGGADGYIGEKTTK